MNIFVPTRFCSLLFEKALSALLVSKISNGTGILRIFYKFLYREGFHSDKNFHLPLKIKDKKMRFPNVLVCNNAAFSIVFYSKNKNACPFIPIRIIHPH